MEAKEKMKLASRAVILLTLAALALLSALGVYSLDKSWPVLILVFALFTLVQSPRDAALDHRGGGAAVPLLRELVSGTWAK